MGHVILSHLFKLAFLRTHLEQLGKHYKLARMIVVISFGGLFEHVTCILNAVRNHHHHTSESLIAIIPKPSLSSIANAAILLENTPLVTCYPPSQRTLLPTTHSLGPLRWRLVAAPWAQREKGELEIAARSYLFNKGQVGFIWSHRRDC
jgi:hypothetical protein